MRTSWTIQPDQRLAAKKKTPLQPAPPAAGQPAGPSPAAAAGDTGSGREIRFTFGERCYRVRGLEKNTGLETLKINLLASRGESLHVDTLELYSARQRSTFINQAAGELTVKQDVVKKDLGRVLLALEQKQEELIRRAMAPKTTEVKIKDDDRRAALELLQSPDLLERILADFDRCGIVGEQTNKLTGYLAAVSRKLDQPLAVIVQSSSAAGKSSLMEAILAFMPEEQQVKYSAMTGQSLFYMGRTDIRHKILAVVEEEGAEKASYALKLLQSEGELTIASTGKDAATGRLTTEEYRVEGPVMIFLTTTAAEIDEELLNRCLVLTVDEARDQTRAIHERQRRSQTLAGLLARRDRDGILAVHRNAQRLLRPLLVANPYAGELTFLDDRTRTRRDHIKYLTLIRTVALLHQYQRPVKRAVHNGRQVEYIEATVDDIAVANRLAHEVLGRSLDELAPQTRRLLRMLDAMVAGVCRKEKIERNHVQFTQRDVRQYTAWSDYQVKTHLRKLVELEYVLALRGGRGRRFVYELLYDGRGTDGRPFVMRLIDVERLRATHTPVDTRDEDRVENPAENPAENTQYDDNRGHPEARRVHRNGNREASGSGRGAAGEHTGSVDKKVDIHFNSSLLSTLAAESPRKPLPGGKQKNRPVMS